MPTLELVCKRLFSDPAWILKCLLGAVLLAVPMAHFFACGYIYEVVNRARRGEAIELPEWEDWRRLFSNGVAAFVIFLVFTAAPLAVAWVLTRPLYVLGAGWFSYVPMMPVLLLCFPLTAAALYLYQKREDYRDAFRPWILLKMLRASGVSLIVPTLALVGLLVTGLPFMTFTLFGGFLLLGATYAATFHHVETTLRAAARRP
jgi:small-conductance mechanosensitive channel